jgi:hypothetical protein
MAINLYSKASVDSLLTAKLSISSLSNAAATTLNETAPTTGQVLSFDGTELKWATPAGGGTWGSITGTLSSQTDLNTALNARVSTAGDTMDNNALLEFNDTVNLSHLGINGNGVTVEGVAGLAGLSANLNMDRLSITDGTDTAEFGLSGIEFADGTTQTTAYTGGGSWLGDRISIYAGSLYNEDTSVYVTNLNLTGASTVDARNLTLQATGGGVLTFSDATTQSTAAIGIPTAGATGQVLTKNSGTNYDVSWVAPSGCVVNTYGSSSSAGSFTWTKPTGAKWVEIYLVGGGGGGGSGARYATTSARWGGGGGGGGCSFYGRINAAYLSSTEAVAVGAGGTGGTSVSSDTTNGNNGTQGGNTTFSIYQSGFGANGVGGTNTTSSGGGGRTSSSLLYSVSVGTGGAGQTTTGNNGTSGTTFVYGLGGGGGGGAAASSTTGANGGVGGAWNFTANASGLRSAIAGGAAGVSSTSTPATAGTSATTQYMVCGTGGGGGYYKTAAAGGTGGAGGWPGGAGGGGASADNGNASGAGGDGANGFAVIITYF